MLSIFACPNLLFSFHQYQRYFMSNIFSVIIFMIFLPITLSAESWIHIDFKGWDNDAFFNGVGWIQKVTLGICFLLGPWQFIPSLYRRNPMLHFALGNVYVMLSLLLAAPAFVISAFSRELFFEILILALLGCFWWWSTRKGIFYISNKKWLLHIEWMSYSYACVICSTFFSLTNEGLHTATLFAIIISTLLLLKIKGLHQKLLMAFFRS